MNRCVVALLQLAVVTIPICAARAQSGSPVTVVPSKVNMVIGEAHTFRAVDRNGHMLRNVNWSVSPSSAATLTSNGDEATLQATQESSEVILTASCGEGTGEAEIGISGGASRPVGSVLWSVKELPGCKTTKITPAVPVPGGPDIFVQEACPDGTYVRAITDDGRELWRRNISAMSAPNDSAKPGNDEIETGQHLETTSNSICEQIVPGMKKNKVWDLVQSRRLGFGENETATNSWFLEEPGFRCTVYFNEEGTVLRKKKTITTE